MAPSSADRSLFSWLVAIAEPFITGGGGGGGLLFMADGRGGGGGGDGTFEPANN